MKYSNRIALSLILVIIIPVILSFIMSMFFLKQNLMEELDERLIESIGTTKKDFIKLKNEMFSRIQVIVIEKELIKYSKTGNRKSLIDILRKLIEISKFEILEVGDINGNVIVRGHNPEIWGENKKKYQIISDALKGKSTSDFEYGLSGLSLRTVVPIISNKKIIGTLMIGTPINIELAQKEKKITSLEIGYYLNNGKSYTTLNSLQKIPEKLRRKTLKTGICLSTITITNKKYRIALEGFFSQDGKFLGIIMSGKALEEALRFYHNVIRLITVDTLISGLLTIFIVILLSKGITKPIERLKEKMTLLGAGNFHTRIDCRQKDEFGELEHDFNKMAFYLENLTRKYHQAQIELLRKEKLALAGSIATELAHEIRNPLNSIAANIELVKIDIENENTKKSRARFNIIKEEITRLDKIIAHLLQSVTPINVSLTNADLLATLKDTINFMREEIEQQNISLEFNYFQDEIIVYHDKTLFRQVFLNLLKNAYDSIHENGNICITITQTPNELEIIFKDSGCGMTVEEQKRIFEPYFTTKEHGSGIGLFFVVKVVESHRGKINVESFLDKGTEIKITLPGTEVMDNETS